MEAPVISDGGTLSEGTTDISPPMDCSKLSRSDKSVGAGIWVSTVSIYLKLSYRVVDECKHSRAGGHFGAYFGFPGML